ncbi:MAG: alpha/beta fold hydrolase [Methyloligellaceae bacterium]
MTRVTTTDNFKLYVEQTGSGYPIIFVHEFAGDHRSWEPQVRYFSRTNNCITYSARGYPPSDVPDTSEHYSQEIARDDILAVLDGLEIEQAHIVGLSMGGFATLHFGIKHPTRARSLAVCGCGYGADPNLRKSFQTEAGKIADTIERDTMIKFADVYSEGPGRLQFRTKDPRGWTEFRNQLREHSTLGSANTMRGVQQKRPSLYDLEEEIAAIRVPTLIMNGDEDEPCQDVGLFLKRRIRSSALVYLPNTGHACNLEEPALFNQMCEKFFRSVEEDRWPVREPENSDGGILL